MFVIRTVEPVAVKHWDYFANPAKQLPDTHETLWMGIDRDSGGYPWESNNEKVAAQFELVEDAFKYLDSSKNYINHSVNDYGVYAVSHSRVDRNGNAHVQRQG